MRIFLKNGGHGQHRHEEWTAMQASDTALSTSREKLTNAKVNGAPQLKLLKGHSNITYMLLVTVYNTCKI